MLVSLWLFFAVVDAVFVVVVVVVVVVFLLSLSMLLFCFVLVRLVVCMFVRIILF